MNVTKILQLFLGVYAEMWNQQLQNNEQDLNNVNGIEGSDKQKEENTSVPRHRSHHH